MILTRSEMFKLNTVVVFLVLAVLRHASGQTSDEPGSGTPDSTTATTAPTTTTSATTMQDVGTFTTDNGTDLSAGTGSDTTPIDFTTLTTSTRLPTTTISTTGGSSDNGNLGLILGLSLGLGIPFLAAVIGGLVYYFKVYKPKQRRVNPASNSTIGAAKDIPLAPVPTPRKPVVSTSDEF